MGHVVLVDPNATALSIAAKNLIYNCFVERASFVSAFVGDGSDEEIEFYTVGSGAAGSRYPMHAMTAASCNATRKVPTVTLDQMVDTCGFVPDLVKIDTEGAEWEVLKGGMRLAEKRRTTFFVEMHSNAAMSMKMNGDRVCAWCASLGYECWYLAEMKKIDSGNQIAMRGRCHVLLVPSGSGLPVGLDGIPQSASAEDVFSRELSAWQKSL